MAPESAISALLVRAIDLYLPIAYPHGVTPRAATMRTQLADAGAAVLASSLVYSDAHADRPRYWVRLGNAAYPHMKLALERPAATADFVLRVDTHDQHCCPDADSPEHGAFCSLMRQNQELAEKIEAAWEADGLPTFKSFLREDLRRRKMQNAE